MSQMNNPPLTQAKILEICGHPDGFSVLKKHAHFENHCQKISKLLNKGLIRMSKRLGDNGGVYVKV